MSAKDGPALPTLRCPNCGSSDLLFRPGAKVRCSRCMRKWDRDELARSPGRAGRSYDDELRLRRAVHG